MIETGPALPKENSSFLTGLGKLIHRIFGWKVTGSLPNEAKIIVIIAPHTSNWDGVFGVSAIFALGLRVHFMAKHTLFEGWTKPLMERLGGVPINRQSSSGVVEQTVNAFNQNDKFWLAIAPEGTRKGAADWKSGFYQIAVGAGASILPVGFDFAKREVCVLPVFHPTGNYQQDLPVILQRFEQMTPAHPENVSAPLKPVLKTIVSSHPERTTTPRK